eukprot:PRCOL_00006289-RA
MDAAREFERAAAGPDGAIAAPALARLSKQYCDLGWNAYAKRAELIWCPHIVPPPPDTEREGRALALRALELAREAGATYPHSSKCRLAVAAALGRLAMYSDNRTKVKMSNEVLEATEDIIATNPDDDYGWHSLGRWHHEMSRMNLAAKLVIKLYYQGSVFNASRDVSIRSYLKAIEIAPGRLVHKVELAKVYEAAGDLDKALGQLDAAMECDVEDYNAWTVRAAGREARDRLRARACARAGGDGGEGAGVRSAALGMGAALGVLRRQPRKLLRQPGRLRRGVAGAVRRRRERAASRRASGETRRPLRRPAKAVARLLRLPDKQLRRLVRRGGKRGAARGEAGGRSGVA